MEKLILIPSKVPVWQRVVNMLRGNYKKVLVCGCLTLFSTAVILVSSLSLREHSGKSKHGSSSVVKFFKSVNRSIDPCHDFYSYCCGTWQKSRNSGSDDEALVTQFNILQKKVNTDLLNIVENLTNVDHLPSIVQSSLKFYSSCVNPVNANEASLQPLLSFFSLMGGWPVLNAPSWSESTFSWTEAVAKTLKMFGIHTFIGFYVSANDKNTSQNLVMLGPPVLKNELLFSTSSQQMLYLIFEALNFHHIHYSEFSVNIAEMTKFAGALHKLLGPVEETKVFTESVKMSVAELQGKIPQLNWVHFIKSVVNTSLQENIDKSYEVLVHNLDCLKSIVNLVESNTFSQKVIANFIGSVIVQELYVVIPGVFENYGHMFNMPATEISEKLRQLCFEIMSKSFVLPLDYIYVQNNLQFNRSKSLEFVKYLKSAFRNLTYNAKWLDNKTESAAVHKLDLMMEVIGYPTILDNATELDKLYENFPVMSSNALQNYFLINEFLVKKEVQKLGSVNLREKYLPPRSITEVGAYYVVNWNILVYPLSIHNAPFYYQNGPWYVNFGAIGSIIAHEITHAFDSLGRERDELGNCRNWWTNSSSLEYRKRTRCFEKQFNNYRIYNTSQNVNGVKTLGENIADSGGLRQAYAAYQLWKADNGEEKVLPGLEDYTPEQLFFISFASVWCTRMSTDVALHVYGNSTHSPPEFRLLGSVSNSEDFAKAFNCAKETPMNPENKCLLW